MRVSIIAQGLSDGGAERVASIVANYLSKEDKVQFIAVYNNEKVYKLQEKVEYRYVNVEKQKSKKRKFVDRCLIIKKYIKDFRPDIIISFIYKETLLLNKTNIIYTLRIDPKASENNFIEKNMRKIFYEKSRGVIFQTVDAMNYFSKKIKNKSAVIYNPIEVNKLPKWEEKEHNKSIITACRLSRQKNIPMLIEAFEQIKSEYDDFIVEIYGDGPEKNNIQNLINQKNLNNKIFLRGYSNDIHNKMATSSLFVLTSDYEGLSNSMLEALCIGIPVICTDCPPGGAKAFIENGKNGFLINVKDKDDLAIKMDMVLNNKEIIYKFNIENRKYRNRLKEEKICEEWKKFINCSNKRRKNV